MELAKWGGSRLGGSRVWRRPILIAADDHKGLWPAPSEVRQVMSVVKCVDAANHVTDVERTGEPSSSFDNLRFCIGAKKIGPVLLPRPFHSSFAKDTDGFVSKCWLWPYSCFGPNQHDGFDSTGVPMRDFERAGAPHRVANNYQRFFGGQVQDSLCPVLDRFTEQIERG